MTPFLPRLEVSPPAAKLYMEGPWSQAGHLARALAEGWNRTNRLFLHAAPPQVDGGAEKQEQPNRAQVKAKKPGRLSGAPKPRPFLTLLLHFPPTSFSSYLPNLGNHCARSLPSGCSWLPLWPLVFIYLVQGHQGGGGINAQRQPGSWEITELEIRGGGMCGEDT